MRVLNFVSLITQSRSKKSAESSMATPSERIDGPVIGAQYCVPSTCQYKLFQTHRGSKNCSVVDAAKGTVIFTLVEHKTNSSRWIPKYETQLVDAQGNIVARIQDEVTYLLLCLL